MAYNSTKKTNRAFTLIELMIVIAIIGILSAVVMTSYASSKKTKALQAASQELTAALRQAQSYALSGKQDTTGKACGWGIIQSSSDATKYDFFYNNVGTAGDCTNDDHKYVTGSSGLSQNFAESALNTGVSIASTDGVYFSLPHGNAYTTNATSGTLITGTNKADISFAIGTGSSQITQHICIFPSGEIVENGTTAC